MGLERLILCMREPERIAGPRGPEFFLATIGDDAFRYATLLARRMRERDVSVELDFDGRSLKSQMRLADKIGARNVVVIGETEVLSGLLTVRDMATRDQRQVTADELVSSEARIGGGSGDGDRK
jgi:histidyl-tRNA synthetase